MMMIIIMIIYDHNEVIDKDIDEDHDGELVIMLMLMVITVIVIMITKQLIINIAMQNTNYFICSPRVIVHCAQKHC